MNLTTLIYDVSDHVATVTLNRPEAMNSFNHRAVLHPARQPDRSGGGRAVGRASPQVDTALTPFTRRGHRR